MSSSFLGPLLAATDSSGRQPLYSLPDPLTAAFRDQRGSLRSIPIALKFTELREGLGSGDYGRPSEYYVYLEGNLFYLHWRRFWRVDRERGILRRATRKDLALEHEVSFDGTVFYHGIPKQGGMYRNARLHKYLAHATQEDEANRVQMEAPFLDAAGLFFPQRVADLAAFTSIEPLVLQYLRIAESVSIAEENAYLRITVHVPDLYLLEHHKMELEQYEKDLKSLRPPGINEEEIEIYKHLRTLEPKRRVSFLLDPLLGYATIERTEWTAKAERILSVSAEGWKHYKEIGMWLPGRCTSNYYVVPTELADFHDTPVAVRVHELKSISFVRREMNFALEYTEPGTAIIDRTTSEAQSDPHGRISYVIPGGESELR